MALRKNAREQSPRNGTGIERCLSWHRIWQWREEQVLGAERGRQRWLDNEGERHAGGREVFEQENEWHGSAENAKSDSALAARRTPSMTLRLMSAYSAHRLPAREKAAEWYMPRVVRQCEGMQAKRMQEQVSRLWFEVGSARRWRIRGKASYRCRCARKARTYASVRKGGVAVGRRVVRRHGIDEEERCQCSARARRRVGRGRENA